MTTTDAELASSLAATTRFGRLQHVRECSSTQDLAAAGADDTLFWADHQTAGRGRQQRPWDDEPGLDLLVTFRLRQRLPNPLALPAVTPLCVLQAVEPALGRRLQLKWPNDVYCDGRKLAGVLIDSDGAGLCLIGIGVNVNRTRWPRELEPTATSLALASGRLHDRAALLLRLAQRLDAAVGTIAAGPAPALEAAFAERLGLCGRRVLITAGEVHEGVLTRLDFQQLQLDGARAFPLGQVSSMRPVL